MPSQSPRQLHLSGRDHKTIFPRRFNVAANLLLVVGMVSAARGAGHASTLLSHLLSEEVGFEVGAILRPLQSFGVATAVILAAVLVGMVGVRPYYRLTRSATIWFLGALVFWYAAGTALVMAIHQPTAHWAIMSSLLGLSLVRLAASSYALARRHAQASAVQVLARDPRPPVVYLRAFAADRATAPSAYRLERRWLLGLLHGDLFKPQFWTEQRGWRFEEVLCAGLRQVGPLVTVGRPAESLPHIGAARVYLSDTMWEVHVATLVRHARLVALLLGRSPGLLWELDLLAKESLLTRTILVFPPDGDTERVWNRFREAVSDPALLEILPTVVPNGTLAIAFAADNTAVLIVGAQTIENYRRLAYYFTYAASDVQGPEPRAFLRPSWPVSSGEVPTVHMIRETTRTSLLSAVIFISAMALAGALGGKLYGHLGENVGLIIGAAVAVGVEIALLSRLLGISYRTLVVCGNLGPRGGVEELVNRLLHAQKRFDVVYPGSRRLAQQLTDDILKGLNALSRAPLGVHLGELRRKFQELVVEFEAQSDLAADREPLELGKALLALAHRADQLADLAILSAAAAGRRSRA